MMVWAVAATLIAAGLSRVLLDFKREYGDLKSELERWIRASRLVDPDWLRRNRNPYVFEMAATEAKEAKAKLEQCEKLRHRVINRAVEIRGQRNELRKENRVLSARGMLYARKIQSRDEAARSAHRLLEGGLSAGISFSQDVIAAVEIDGYTYVTDGAAIYNFALCDITGDVALSVELGGRFRDGKAEAAAEGISRWFREAEEFEGTPEPAGEVLTPLRIGDGVVLRFSDGGSAIVNPGYIPFADGCSFTNLPDLSAIRVTADGDLLGYVMVIVARQPGISEAVAAFAAANKPAGEEPNLDVLCEGTPQSDAEVTA